MTKTAPKAVGIEGRTFEFRFQWEADAPAPGVSWVELPDDLVEPVAGEETRPARRAVGEIPGLGVEYAVPLRAKRPGRGRLRARIGDAVVTVPVVVFRPSEFFLCMVLSSNYHYGWDPLLYLFGGTPENLELEGDAWPKLRQLEKMYHMRGIPVTWLVDEKVAEKAAASIEQWHVEYGDDYGIMPTSYIHHCAVNYNFTKTTDEVTDFMRHVKQETEARFSFYTTTFAIDQFLGSVGSKFAEGAFRLGIQGLWGVGLDHRTCDTSMYHRGCPWDIYKPHRRNYRIPADHPSTMWMYQWTTRDALLSLHSPDDGPSGAVIFSTDPDDQRNSRIAYEQPTYWEEFFRGYRENFPPQETEDAEGRGNKPLAAATAMDSPSINDVYCFLIHQEDHDCGFPENADLLRRFLDGVQGTATFATMEEVSAWLNLKYSPDEHPGQALYLEDHLRCHAKVEWYANLQKPDDWPGEGEHYPPGILFYDRDAFWCAGEGEIVPWRYFDYRPRTEVDETEVYPEEDLRESVRFHSLAVEREADAITLKAVVHSTQARVAVPLIFWHVLAGRKDQVPVLRSNVIAIRDCLVVFQDLAAGENQMQIEFAE